MKKITLTRNGQTSPRDTEVSTMHADGLVVGQGVMLRVKGDCCYKGPSEYEQYVVTKIVKSDRFDKKCSDITFVRAGKKATGETPVVPVEPAAVVANTRERDAAYRLSRQYAMMKLIAEWPDLFRRHAYSLRDIHFRNIKRTGKNNIRLVSCEAYWPQGAEA